MAITNPAANRSDSVPAVYKAAVVHDFDAPLTIEELPRPELLTGQIRVEVAASGLCHTDIHAARGDWPVKPSPPFVPGHEGVGSVVELGLASPRSRSETGGDAVAWLRVRHL